MWILWLIFVTNSVEHHLALSPPTPFLDCQALLTQVEYGMQLAYPADTSMTYTCILAPHSQT